MYSTVRRFGWAWALATVLFVTGTAQVGIGRVKADSPEQNVKPEPRARPESMQKKSPSQEALGVVQRSGATDESEMVLIPAGDFNMGSKDDDDGYPSEKPPHRVYLDAFYMDRYEVTNARYGKFLQATSHSKPMYWDDPKFNQPSQPVVGVSWNDVVVFCQWAGKRLPTEAEWEKAARGGLEGKKYPWGDEDPQGKACFWEHCDTGKPVNVGVYPPNGYGLFDMAGNVWECCSDWYDEEYYRRSPDRNPSGPPSGISRVVRGGSWLDNLYNDVRCALRESVDPSERSYDHGFRCAASGRCEGVQEPLEPGSPKPSRVEPETALRFESALTPMSPDELARISGLTQATSCRLLDQNRFLKLIRVVPLFDGALAELSDGHRCMGGNSECSCKDSMGRLPCPLLWYLHGTALRSYPGIVLSSALN